MGITTATPLPLDVTYKQLSDGNTGGTSYGKSPTDLVGFYGNPTPVAQQAVITPNGPGGVSGQDGVVAVMLSAVASPTTPGVTTAEKGITILNATSTFLVASTDLLYVNKPTAQAGLGIGNARYSASNVLGLTFSNFTAATITPTASQSYTVVALRGIGALTPTLTPAAVAPTTVAEQQFNVSGLIAGQLGRVSKPTAQAGLEL